MEIKYKETVTTFWEIPIGELFKFTRPPLSRGFYMKVVDAFDKRCAVNIKSGRILTDVNQNDQVILVRGIIIIEGSEEK